jgi:hypothetical protein
MHNIRYCSYLSPAESSTCPHLISCFYEPFSYYPPFTLMSAKWSLPTKFCSLFSWRSLFNFVYPTVKERSRGSSGSIVSDYGLNNRAIGVRSPAGAKDFSSNLCIQTGYGAHPASCAIGTRGPLPGGKARPGRDADHSPPSSAEVVNE